MSAPAPETYFNVPSKKDELKCKYEALTAEMAKIKTEMDAMDQKEPAKEPAKAVDAPVAPKAAPAETPTVDRDKKMADYKGMRKNYKKMRREMAAMKTEMARMKEGLYTESSGSSGYGQAVKMDDPEDLDLNLDKEKAPDLCIICGEDGCKTHPKKDAKVDDVKAEKPEDKKESVSSISPAYCVTANNPKDKGKLKLYFNEADEIIKIDVLSENNKIVFSSGSIDMSKLTANKPVDKAAKKSVVEAIVAKAVNAITSEGYAAVNSLVATTQVTTQTVQPVQPIKPVLPLVPGAASNITVTVPSNVAVLSKNEAVVLTSPAPVEVKQVTNSAPVEIKEVAAEREPGIGQLTVVYNYRINPSSHVELISAHDAKSGKEFPLKGVRAHSDMERAVARVLGKRAAGDFKTGILAKQPPKQAIAAPAEAVEDANPSIFEQELDTKINELNIENTKLVELTKLIAAEQRTKTVESVVSALIEERPELVKVRDRLLKAETILSALKDANNILEMINTPPILEKTIPDPIKATSKDSVTSVKSTSFFDLASVSLDENKNTVISGVSSTVEDIAGRVRAYRARRTKGRN